MILNNIQPLPYSLPSKDGNLSISTKKKNGRKKKCCEKYKRKGSPCKSCPLNIS